MRKFKKSMAKTIIALMMVALLFIFMTGCEQQTGGSSVTNDVKDVEQNNYCINWQVDMDTQTVNGKQTVEYFNTENVELTEIYFHLYPNYFDDEESLTCDENDKNLAYLDGFEKGGIEITSLKLNGSKIPVEYTDDTQGLLKVELNESLAVGESVKLDFEYVVDMPEFAGRFGINNNTIKMCNMYPIAAVYDDNGWNLDEYITVGDPFYSDMSDYDVTIKLDNRLVLAGTGDKEFLNTQSGYSTYSFDCKDVRDIAYVASYDFEVISDTVDGITVNSYYYLDEEMGKVALDAAVNTIKTMNEKYGAYPYNEYNVVATDLYYGGMEYPNLVQINQTLYNEDYLKSLEYTVVHETAHQWWYGLVGNDQIDYPWLDEALTEYSTLVYYREVKSDEEYDTQVNAVDSYYLLYESIYPMKVGGTTRDYENNDEYFVSVYKGGQRMMLTIEEDLGYDILTKALQLYFRENEYKNATPDDLFNAIKQECGRDMHIDFDVFLDGND